MENQYQYMIKRDGDLPTLLRLESSGVYRSGTFDGQGHFYWIFTPELADIPEHRERFPEYADISEEEAEQVMEQLKKEFARREEEKHVIIVQQSQISTGNGTVFVDTYTKGKEHPGFRDVELERLLSELAGKEGMEIQEINYSFFDYWGYEKLRTTTNKEDIHEICGSPLKIDGYFTDGEMKYRFMYKGRKEKVIVAKCQKDSGIDLKTAFEDGAEKGI